MSFLSDTGAPAHPTILEALVAANAGAAPSYGADPWTARAHARLAEVFETDVEVLLVGCGTAANALALSILCPPTGAVLCHEEAHIACDERGAPEFFTGGGKLQLLPGPNAIVELDALEEALRKRNPAFVHETPAQVLSMTTLTERGAAMTPAEIAARAELAQAHGLFVHLDGARLANSVVGSGASLADLTWRAGVDVVTFGATKCGALGCEAIVLFGNTRAKKAELLARAKRAGHLPPKMRFLAAQMNAFLENELWLTLAGQANAAAGKLAFILSRTPGALLLAPTTDLARAPLGGNEVFVALEDNLAQALEAAGARFYRWFDGGYRFVTSWATADAEIAAVTAVCDRVTASAAQTPQGAA